MKFSLLTLQEYADIKKVSLKTVYNWINKGKIKPIVMGKTKFLTHGKN